MKTWTRTTGVERVEPNIDLSNPEGCWPWLGARTVQGYGRLNVQYQSHRAHRYVYEALVGPIPEGLHIDHLCKNTLCVNPDHLEPVTPGENNRRGDNPFARNARKTHCIRGHALTGDNLLPGPLLKLGQRQCRECSRIRYLNVQAQKKPKKKKRDPLSAER